MDESLERWGYVLESRGVIASRSQTETGVNSEDDRIRGLSNWGQKKPWTVHRRGEIESV